MSTGAAELIQDTSSTIGVADSARRSRATIAARSPLQLFWRRLRRDKVALAALGFIVLLVLVAIFAPLIVKLVGAPPPERADAEARSTTSARPAGPSSRPPASASTSSAATSSPASLYGARVSLEVALIATALIVSIGVVDRHGRRLLPRLGRHACSRASWTSCSRSRCCCSRSASAPRARSATAASAALIQPGLPVVIFVIVARQLALLRPHHPRPGALAAREGVRRGGPLAGRLEHAASSSARSSPTWSRRSSSTRR